MSAFFFFDNLEVTDPAALETYKNSVGPVVAKYGGRYRVLGGAMTAFEGSWQPRYPVIIEFDDADKARAWYNSEDYSALKALRQSAVVCNAVLIEGL